MSSRDPDIRGRLVSWVTARDSAALLRHEVELRGMRRADLLSIHLGKLVGYEIKSDSDDLVRLRWQEPAYSKTCDECWLVTGERLIVEGADRVPTWWGLLVCSGNDVEVIRESASNPDPPNAMLEMLWVPELRFVLRALGLRCPTTGKWGLMGLVRETLGSDEALAAARGMLARRAESGWGKQAIAAVERACAEMGT